jgi:hypothetical protein
MSSTSITSVEPRPNRAMQSNRWPVYEDLRLELTKGGGSSLFVSESCQRTTGFNAAFVFRTKDQTLTVPTAIGVLMRALKTPDTSFAQVQCRFLMLSSDNIRSGFALPLVDLYYE